MRKFRIHIILLMMLMLVSSCSVNEGLMESIAPDTDAVPEGSPSRALTLLSADGAPIANLPSGFSQYRLAVCAEGSWSLEPNGDFIEVFPSKGFGNDTVAVMVADNWWKDREVKITMYAASSNSPDKGEQGTRAGQGDAQETLVGIQDGAISPLFGETEVNGALAVRGAGCSYLPNTVYCMGTGMEVLNKAEMMAIQKEANVNLLMDDFYPETQQDVFSADNLDDLDNQLSITASATIKYGLFTLNIKGDFDKESTSETEKEYAVMRLKQCNFTRELNIANVIALIRQSPEYRNRILAPGYRYILDEFVAGIHGTDDELEHYTLCEQFLQTVGPAVVSKAMYGTVMDYYYSIEKSKLASGMTAGGAVTASFGAVFDISLSGDIHYTEEQKKYANESRKTFKVRGGDIQKISSLTVGKQIPYTQLREWMLSVQPENAALIDMRLTPIYSLVDDAKAHELLVNYINHIQENSQP